MNKTLLPFAWICTFATFILDHVNVLVGAIAGVMAIAASYWSIRVKREQYRQLRKRRDPEMPHNVPALAAMFITGLLFPATGCGTVPTAVDRSLYTVATNLVPQVEVKTNIVAITNVQTVVVTRTNAVDLTNYTTVVTLATNVVSVTNWAPQIVLQPNPAAESAIKETGGAVGDLFGMGGVLSLLLGGGYHIYMQMRNRRVGAVLVQSVETAREILKGTPQGQEVDAKYRAWLVDHQKALNVLGPISKLVDAATDNDMARAVARLIADEIARGKPPQT